MLFTVTEYGLLRTAREPLQLLPLFYLPQLYDVKEDVPMAISVNQSLVIVYCYQAS